MRSSVGSATSKLMPRFMLIVCATPPATPSASVVVSSTLRHDCTLTLNRTGPSADAQVFGRYARLPLITTDCSMFGDAPVTTSNTGGFFAAIFFSAEPFDLKPVSAIGFSTACLISLWSPVPITATRPSL